MSVNILKQLYRGDYCPRAKTFCADASYDALLARKTNMEDRFEDALPKSMRDEFVEYLHISAELSVMDEEIAFCEGVRLGVRLTECVKTDGE